MMTGGLPCRMHMRAPSPLAGEGWGGGCEPSPLGFPPAGRRGAAPTSPTRGKVTKELAGRGENKEGAR